MTDLTHLIKLSVGTESVEGLAAWHQNPQAQGPDGLPRHVTRMWPKRAAEILEGGSIFWVIKGLIQCRQRILRFDEVRDAEDTRFCAIVLEPQLYPTAPTPKRPFQGWRYLNGADAPPDLSRPGTNDSALPAGLSKELADLGVL